MPAAIALRAARRKSSMIASISATVSSRGTGTSAHAPAPSASTMNVFPGAAIALGATGGTPSGWNTGCDTRPTCHNCRKIVPPLA